MDSQTRRPEDLLWKRTGIAIILGMITLGLFSAGLVAVAVPGTAIANLVGIGLFIAFWSGPFFGATAGVAYHQRAITTAPKPVPLDNNRVSPVESDRDRVRVAA